MSETAAPNTAGTDTRSASSSRFHAIDIVKRPLISEKSYWEADRHGRYAFEVAMTARKPQIKAAIEYLYGVKVDKVRTQVRQGHSFRNRWGYGHSGRWKKALVSLKGDDRIELI